MKPTFESTVDILVKAYLNDTLEHQNCFACAVGNIIAARLKLSFIVRENEWHELQWKSNKPDWYDYIAGNSSCTPDAEKQIQATGYSVSEVKRIEYAFENCERGPSKDSWMFNGLMAVVDVLADIHGIDLKVKEEAKLLFVKL